MKKPIIVIATGALLVLAIYLGFTNKPPKLSAFDEKRMALLDSLDFPEEAAMRQLEKQGLNDVATLDSLSHLWFHAGYADIAADFERRIADLQPSPATYLRAGNSFLAALPSDTSQTIQVNMVYGARYSFEQAIALDSNLLEARIGLGKVLVQGTNEPMQGILMLRELDAKYPENIEINLELGRFSMMSNQFDKAIERFNTVLQKDSLHLQALFLLAESYMATGQTDAAIKELEKTIGLTGDPAMDAQVKMYIESLTK